MMEKNEGVGQFTEVVGESLVGTIPGEFGGLLQQAEVQYVANKDKHGTWRVLNQWSSELMHLSPDDEIEDDNPAVTVLSEGIFSALIQAAVRTGTYPQLNQLADSSEQMTVEDTQQMAELTAEVSLLKNTNEMLEGQITGLKQHIDDEVERAVELEKVVKAEPVPVVVPAPVSTEPTLHAMDLIAALANGDRQVQAITLLAKD